MSEEKFNTQIEDIQKSIEKIFETLKQNGSIRENTGIIINNNFEILNKKMDNISKRIDSLHSDTNQNFDDVKLELVKIQTATNYMDLYDNLNAIKNHAGKEVN